MMNNLHEAWITAKLAAIGMLGAAFMAWYHRRNIGNWKDAFVYVVFGGAIAHFGTPLAIWMFHFDPENTGSIGFFLGAFGGCISKWLWNFIASGALTELIKSRFGGGQ